MIIELTSKTFIITIADRKFRATWNELDGLTIHGVSEEIARIVIAASGAIRPRRAEPVRHAEDVTVEPPPKPMAPIVFNPTPKESEAAGEAEQATTPEGESANATELATEAPSVAEATVISAPVSPPAPASPAVEEPEPEPGLDLGPELTWPTVGETWTEMVIVRADVVERPGDPPYAKLVLENGDKVKVIMSGGLLVEERRIAAPPIEPEPEPAVETTASDTAPLLPDDVPVPPERCRDSDHVSDTIRWLIEDRGIEDRGELIRLCDIYKESKFCRSFEKVTNMDRRVGTTLFAMGRADSP